MLELDGKVVSNRVPDFNKQIADIKSDTPVEIVVMRKGRKETVKETHSPRRAERTFPAHPLLPTCPYRRAGSDRSHARICTCLGRSLNTAPDRPTHFQPYALKIH